MNRIHQLLALVIIILAFASCKKEPGDTGDNQGQQTSLEDVVISPDFDWKNTRQLELEVSSSASLIIEIQAKDSDSILHKAFHKGGENASYHTSLTLPACSESIRVNGVLYNIENNLVQINMDDGSKKLKAGSETDAIVSYWALDENQGDIASDALGENDGDIISADWTQGIVGSALYFDGNKGAVIVPEAENLDITDNISLTAWVKPEENKEAKIAQKGDWDGYNIGLGKWYGWKAYMMMEDESHHSIEWGQGVPLMDEWCFIAMTYNGSSFRLYVNGSLKVEKQVSGKLKNNGRDFCIGSDNNAQKYFHGIIDEVGLYNHALSAGEIADLYEVMPNTDSDGDGIPDFQDDYSTDPQRAFNTYWPSGSGGSLAFEDLWPGLGDFDFNDLVLDFQFTTVTNAENYVVEIFGDFTIRAVGASHQNGFGFQLSNAFDDAVITVSGYMLSEDFIQLKANGTEESQDKTTIIVFDNTYSLLHSAGGTGVNVSTDYPYVEPETIEILIDFADNQFLPEDIAIEQFNPFLIVNKNRGKEIHLADFQPSKLADTSLFGTVKDNSLPSEGRYYKTSNNVPWAIMLPNSFDYPLERTEITQAFLHFVEWAESSGENFNDWYLDKSGYRDALKIY